MRYLLIFILFLPFSCLGQHSVISATKMNMLYIGIENPISFAVENMKCSELTIAVENGTAKRTGECEYNVVVRKPGNTLLFIIKGNDTISKTLYRANHIPNPIIREGAGESYWSLDSVKSKNRLSVVLEHFDFDTPWHSILTFKTSVIGKRTLTDESKIYCSECAKQIKHEYYSAVFSEINNGPNFSDSLKEFIRNKLQHGDIIFFEDIEVLGPDKQIRTLGSIRFRVE